jgi:hypothetical protein
LKSIRQDAALYCIWINLSKINKNLFEPPLDGGMHGGILLNLFLELILKNFDSARNYSNFYLPIKYNNKLKIRLNNLFVIPVKGNLELDKYIERVQCVAQEYFGNAFELFNEI